MKQEVRGTYRLFGGGLLLLRGGSLLLGLGILVSLWREVGDGGGRSSEPKGAFQTTIIILGSVDARRRAHLLDDIVQGDVHLGDAAVSSAHGEPADGEGCERHLLYEQYVPSARADLTP